LVTEYANLRRHLKKQHLDEYEHVAKENGWNIKFPSLTDKDSAHKNARMIHNQALPQFSPESFIEYLIRFIVTDDQVCFDDPMLSKVSNTSDTFSLFASLNALSSETYAWSSARPLSMLTSLAAIK
jgi:hypothetical protein